MNIQKIKEFGDKLVELPKQLLVPFIFFGCALYIGFHVGLEWTGSTLSGWQEAIGFSMATLMTYALVLICSSLVVVLLGTIILFHEYIQHHSIKKLD